MAEIYDVAIVGASDAGLHLALSLAQELNVVLLERTPHVAGRDRNHDLLREALSQLPITYLQQEVMAVNSDAEPLCLTTLDGHISARAVVVTTGANARNGRLPGETDLLGKGVSDCAARDAGFFAELLVAVVGGDERAAEAVLALAPRARAVTLICPFATLALAPATRVKLSGKSNVSVLTNTDVTEVLGDGRVTGLTLKDADGNHTLKVNGVFVYLCGERPETGFLAGAVTTGLGGAIRIDAIGQTNLANLYALGSVTGGSSLTAPYAALAKHLAHGVENRS